MKKLIPAILCLLTLCGCAGGPPKVYYNPKTLDLPAFKGEASIEIVDDLELAQKRYVADGYRVIGTSAYGGDQPKAIELKAQARRVHASKVIYHLNAPTGSTWKFQVGMWGGSGGGGYGVYIVYLGK